MSEADTGHHPGYATRSGRNAQMPLVAEALVKVVAAPVVKGLVGVSRFPRVNRAMSICRREATRRPEARPGQERSSREADLRGAV